MPGYSVLLFTGFPPSRDLQVHPPIIQIVRTLPYDTGISIGGQPTSDNHVSGQADVETSDEL